MKTISRQQFAQTYGQEGLAQFDPLSRSAPMNLAIGAAKGARQIVKETGDLIQSAAQNTTLARVVPNAQEAIRQGGDAIQEMAGLTDENLTAEGTAQKVGKGSALAASIAGPLAAPRLASLGLSAGRKVGEALADTTKGTLSKGKSWLVSDAPLSVENVLKDTPTKRFDEYVQLAQKATENNKNITPLEFAGKRAQEALDQLNRKAASIGANKSAIITSAAGRIPVGNVLVKFRQQLQNSIANKTGVDGDKRIYADVLEKAKALGDNPTAQSVDAFIDYVQDRIYTGKRDLTLPITDDVQTTLRPITGQLNEALKAKLPESYRTLNQQYSDLIEIRNELNLKLGAEGEKGGALMKRVFSPSDANTKELFGDVLDITGIDLVDEATLAKYVMDTLGDARQKSMLEQLKIVQELPSSPSGLLGWLASKASKLVDTPEAQLKKARAKTIPASD